MRRDKITTFTERGYFWLHGTDIPESRLGPENGATPGTLSIDDEGRIDLDLDGVLSSEGLLMPGQPTSPIQGVLKTGHKPHVLLVGLYKNGGALRSEGITYEKYFAEKCVRSDISLGSDFENILFKDLYVDLAGYEEWLNICLIDVKNTETSSVASYTHRDDDIHNFNGSQLRIQYGCHRPTSFPQYVLNWKQLTRIVFTPDAPLPLDGILNIYHSFQDLLVLLTDGYHGLEWPGLASNNDAQCTCYLSRNRNIDRAIYVNMYPVGFSQIRENFGSIWLAWQQFRDNAGPGAYLYLSTRKGNNLYPENRFANLMWGIESLQRRSVASSHPAHSAISKKIIRIVGQVSRSCDRNWLNRQLRHAHEPSLANRFSELFKSLPLGIEKERLDRFAKRCADRRNDISHFGGQRQNSDYDSFVKHLMKETDALSILYHAYILQKIGINDNILYHWIHESPQAFFKKRVLNANDLLDSDDLGAPL